MTVQFLMWAGLVLQHRDAIAAIKGFALHRGIQMLIVRVAVGADLAMRAGPSGLSVRTNVDWTGIVTVSVANRT